MRAADYPSTSGAHLALKWLAATETKQSIDSNFAEINKALTTELLPALRRFAIATEPIRDVSKVRNMWPYDQQWD